MIKINYALTEFYTTVNDLAMLPTESIAEIAICGRSNAGKSTLLNVLTRQKRLAFTSKTPGRTQHINFFSIPGALGSFLVDLPGYGYAKVPAAIRTHWQDLLAKYLQTRSQIVGLVLIMDIRHPLKELDLAMLNFMSAVSKPVHIVLSKADKLNMRDKIATLNDVRISLNNIAQLNNVSPSNYTVQIFSSTAHLGLDDLTTTLDGWLLDKK